MERLPIGSNRFSPSTLLIARNMGKKFISPYAKHKHWALGSLGLIAA